MAILPTRSRRLHQTTLHHASTVFLRRIHGRLHSRAGTHETCQVSAGMSEQIGQCRTSIALVEISRQLLQLLHNCHHTRRLFGTSTGERTSTDTTMATTTQLPLCHQAPCITIWCCENTLSHQQHHTHNGRQETIEETTSTPRQATPHWTRLHEFTLSTISLEHPHQHRSTESPIRPTTQTTAQVTLHH